jgi:hypothetical protein
MESEMVHTQREELEHTISPGVMIIRDYDSDANFLLSSIPCNRPLLHLYTDYPLPFVLLPDP